MTLRVYHYIPELCRNQNLREYIAKIRRLTVIERSLACREIRFRNGKIELIECAPVECDKYDLNMILRYYHDYTWLVDEITGHKQ